MVSDQDVIIEFSNVVKRFKVSHIWKPALSTQVDSYVKRLFQWGRKQTTTIDYKNAVNDVSLTVSRGATIGIMGHNAAGKSTLLKLMANVTQPTSGTVSMYGRVAPLLEVGAGFHHEFTGRENVFLNGVILGMKYKEVEAAFDDIVSFAGVEEYIDVPLKKYSSGMVVRLGFSIAVHSNPEILLIDEVLAVGDDEFQKKCVEKVMALKADDKVTIVIVSHDIRKLHEICDTVYVFDHGSIVDVITPTNQNISQ